MSACSTPPEAAILNLEDVQRFEDPDSFGLRDEVIDRGWWERTRVETAALIGVDTAPRQSAIDDPVEFCLDNLETLRDADEDDLAGLDRMVAILVVARSARLSSVRIIRADAFRTLRELTVGVGGLYLAPGEERSLEEVAILVLPIQKVVESEPSAAPQVARAIEGALLESCRALVSWRSDRASLAERVAQLAILASHQAGDARVARSLADVAASQALHATVLSCMSGVDSDSDLVRAAAVETLLRLDLLAGSQFLGRNWGQLASPLVRVAMFRTLFADRCRPQDLDPIFRRRVGAELTSGDAAVAYWARKSLAAILGLDAKTAPLDEIRAQWQSLGDWEATSERS